MPLIQNLPSLLPANALADIQSVEMCWDLGQVAQPPVTDQDISAEPRFDGWRLFLSLLGQLPKSLPRLRYLHLTLRGVWFPPQMAVNDIVRHSEPAMLQPLDEMLRQLCRSSGWDATRYIVAIPTNVFRARMSLDSHSPKDGPEIPFELAPRRRLMWRSLENEGADQSGLENKSGYWLDNALDDVQLLREQATLLDRVPLSSLSLAGDW